MRRCYVLGAQIEPACTELHHFLFRELEDSLINRHVILLGREGTNQYVFVLLTDLFH